MLKLHTTAKTVALLACWGIEIICARWFSACFTLRVHNYGAGCSANKSCHGGGGDVSPLLFRADDEVPTTQHRLNTTTTAVISVFATLFVKHLLLVGRVEGFIEVYFELPQSQFAVFHRAPE